MDLDYYLWKNKIKFKDFARKLGIDPSHVSKLVQKKTTPSLIVAMKIHEESKGKIPFEEMISFSDKLKN